MQSAIQGVSAHKARQAVKFNSVIRRNPSAPGYGRIWRLPVNFTIDRMGKLADDGWKDKDPVWTPSRLEQIVTPLLQSPM